VKQGTTLQSELDLKCKKHLVYFYLINIEDGMLSSGAILNPFFCCLVMFFEELDIHTTLTFIMRVHVCD